MLLSMLSMNKHTLTSLSQNATVSTQRGSSKENTMFMTKTSLKCYLHDGANSVFSPSSPAQYQQVDLLYNENPSVDKYPRISNRRDGS